MYDMKLLSTYDIDASGNPVDADSKDKGKYSWLLVRGRMSSEVTSTAALNINIVTDPVNIHSV